MTDRELPKLNEVVYGVILKWVIKKEQDRLLKTDMIFSKPEKVNLKVDWPTSLQLNSERLVHHTGVKLLPNSTLCFDWWMIKFRWSYARRQLYADPRRHQPKNEIL